VSIEGDPEVIGLPRPQISIVIPTYDRPRPLATLLEALARLDDSSHRFEVVIVDDGSPHPAEPGVAAFRERLRLNVIRQDNAGPAAARNRGAACAVGDRLVFIDDDCRPHPGWLDSLSRAMRESPDGLCGGRIANASPHSLCATAHQYVFDFLGGNGSGRAGSTLVPSANMAVDRTRFLEVGGFDETMRFGEDREFAHRWAAGGRPIVDVPDAVVRHVRTFNLVSLLALHFRYGGGTYQYWRRVDWSDEPRGRLASMRSYLGLVLSGVRRDRSWRGVLVSALLLGTQAAGLAGIAREALRSACRAGRSAAS
jgi:glycosyltransferase involved in cell wall biosynthesis